MSAEADLLVAERLTTHLSTAAGAVRAVDGVSLRIAPGEAVALVGESGCGKTMTAFSLMRLVRPPGRILAGRVLFGGQNLLELGEAEMRRLRGGRIGMVFQDPMTFLNPLMRIGDQIVEAIRLHRSISRAAAWDEASAALQRVRIAAPADVMRYYPHQLSGGMRQRVLIAMAVSCRPDLLIADEPTTALDVTIQAQIMDLLREVRRELGSALLLITHDLGLVAEYCERVYVMYAGQIVEEGEVRALFRAPKHPYTRALLKLTLSIDHGVAAYETIEGQPPDLARPPDGCRFHPRCPEAFDRCSREEPPASSREDQGWARCWLHTSR